ncbi:hypothetical protein SKAU_G00053820 [Synaphobranchus kaupii]|uniref:Uncharacterized protein n=1 Tax=Synaphobranchus kaupii TaxID=118154 RepID=A0A9Q1G4K7_SYNKA|nr:hypothetical protein SKAU_G00053820 [Synaphobranchus kaupii]
MHLRTSSVRWRRRPRGSIHATVGGGVPPTVRRGVGVAEAPGNARGAKEQSEAAEQEAGASKRGVAWLLRRACRFGPSRPGPAHSLLGERGGVRGSGSPVEPGVQRRAEQAGFLSERAHQPTPCQVAGSEQDENINRRPADRKYRKPAPARLCAIRDPSLSLPSHPRSAGRNRRASSRRSCFASAPLHGSDPRNAARKAPAHRTGEEMESDRERERERKRQKQREREREREDGEAAGAMLEDVGKRREEEEEERRRGGAGLGVRRQAVLMSSW